MRAFSISIIRQNMLAYLIKYLQVWSISTQKYNELIDNILIYRIGMSKQSGLIIGSIIFLFLGIVAAIAFHIYVGMKSPGSTKKANQQVSLVSVIIATISMWIMWACTYMHQMNPLIQPILMVKAE